MAVPVQSLSLRVEPCQRGDARRRSRSWRFQTPSRARPRRARSAGRTRRPSVDVLCRSCSDARGARCSSSAPTTCRSTSETGRAAGAVRPVRRGFRRGLAMGALSGLVAVVVAEAVRPRGGTTLLLDWDEVTRLATAGLREERVAPERLASAAAAYNGLAADLTSPLLEALGGLPAGARLPEFQALDRAGWLELNVGILRR